MNKRQIVASLNTIANELDTAKLHKQADIVTKVMSRLAMDGNDEYGSMHDMGYCPDCGEWVGDDQHCEDCGWGMDDEEDFELGLGAVPHKRIKNPSSHNEDQYGDDYDISLDDEFPRIKVDYEDY